MDKFVHTLYINYGFCFTNFYCSFQNSQNKGRTFFTLFCLLKSFLYSGYFYQKSMIFFFISLNPNLLGSLVVVFIHPLLATVTRLLCLYLGGALL